MSEDLSSGSVMALLKLYDQLLQRIEALEEQVAQMGDGYDDEPKTYMDGTPIR